MTKIEVHKKICKEMTDLYEKKNADYGDSFANARTEIPFYTLGRLYDKFSRYKHLSLSLDEANYESIEDTLFDLANYCIMELVERQVDRTLDLSSIGEDTDLLSQE